jgi:uncharacterized protein (TIGR00251 family)
LAASSDSHHWCREDGDDLVLLVKTQPRASRDEFAGVRQERLHIRIKAPPVDGRANSYLLAWLADQFGVGRRNIVLEQGHGSRLKRVRIHAPARVPTAVAKLLP